MLWWDPIEGTKPNNKLLQEFLDDFDIIECIFLSQGWHYDSFPVFTFIRCRLVFDDFEKFLVMRHYFKVYFF